MKAKTKGATDVLASDAPFPESHIPLRLDASGLLFVEAHEKICRGSAKLAQLQRELIKHRRRVAAAQAVTDKTVADSAWIDVIQGVGSLEPTYGKTIRDFLVADVLLVAAAEAYINSIASQILPGSEADHFDKLAPVGKWLFLPKVMKLKWQPSLSRQPLQQFAALVARRNRVIHPKVIQVKSILDVEEFLKTLRLDTKSANDGLLAVKGLIQEISLSWRGSYGPLWLDENEAKKHPPCFIFGEGARLGRLSTRRKSAGV